MKVYHVKFDTSEEAAPSSKSFFPVHNNNQSEVTAQLKAHNNKFFDKAHN